MRELQVSETLQISGAGLVIMGGVSGNTGSGGPGGVDVGIAIGAGGNVTINGQSVPPTSNSKNGVGVSIGSRWNIFPKGGSFLAFFR
ncbi:hypothetical protein [Burkholderia ubonensis]|uniref:hypothetical protein n=1 Tax=Burkholderia ubonensis TaxID=101571 RepID=UPI002AB1827A|nr:hypothetical protein [Burkholderia ubonensis]